MWAQIGSVCTFLNFKDVGNEYIKGEVVDLYFSLKS